MNEFIGDLVEPGGHVVGDGGLWALELLAHRGAHDRWSHRGVSHRGVHRGVPHPQSGVLMGILEALSREVVVLIQRRRKVGLCAHVLNLSLQLHPPVLEPGSNLKRSTNRNRLLVSA